MQWSYVQNHFDSHSTSSKKITYGRRIAYECVTPVFEPVVLGETG